MVPSASATSRGSGIQAPGPPHVLDRLVPAPQRRLGRPEEAEQLHVVRREGETLGVLLDGPRVVAGDQPVVIPQRPVPHRILRVQRQRPLGGGARPVRHRRRWRAVAVQVRVGARQRRPRRHEARIECHRLLEVPDGLAELGPARCPSARCAWPFRKASYAARFRVGRFSSTRCCRLPIATSSACATRPAMSACTWNTSVIDASNGCCHFASAVDTSISSGLTCTRLAAPDAPFCQRTLPTSR